MKKALLFLPLLCLASAQLADGGFKMVSADASQSNSTFISCEDTFEENSSYYLSIGIKPYEQISSLSLEFHFDSDAITINSVGFYGFNGLCDKSISENCINFSAIFYSLNLYTEVSLLSVSFSTKEQSQGDYYFDLLVSEAYNSSMESVEISSSRKHFSIVPHQEQPSAPKTAHSSLTSNVLETQLNDEFVLSYSLDTDEPSSGSFLVSYDDSLFEVSSLTKGDFFDDALFDYNISTKGTIYISFVMTTKASSFSMFDIKFKTIANVETSSRIDILANDLYDSEMNEMIFSGSSAFPTIHYQEQEQTHPSMSTTYSIDTENKQITLNVLLESNSHLGAGDFILSFNKDLVSYVSNTKNFSPDFFTVNDKEQQLLLGQVKFSIISLTDIVDSINVITFIFSYNESSSIQHVSFGLTATALTDSLTNPIELDILGVELDIAATDFIIRWSKTYLYMDDESYSGEGTGKCASEGLYETAKRELLKLDAESIEDFATDADSKYTAALARYQAWARANHDDSPFEANYDFLNGSLGQIMNVESTSPLLITVLIVSISIIAFGCYTLIRRKKTK